MQITLIKEHEKCPYNGFGERTVIERIAIKKKDEIKIETNSNKIILLLEGELYVAVGVNEAQKVEKEQMFYVAIEQHLTITAISNSVVFVFRLQDRIKLCNCFLLEKLSHYSKDRDKQLPIERQFHILPVYKSICDNLVLLTECIKANLICKHYYDLKLNELLFLIGKFYKMDELALFFKDSLSNDVFFSEYVRRNSHKYNTMSEFAEAMNYTISGFEKRFKKVFKITPYQWMKERKAQRIYYDLSMTDRCLKEIVDNYGFKSNNYFIDFCKSNFGTSPGRIRKNRGTGKKT